MTDINALLDQIQRNNDEAFERRRMAVQQRSTYAAQAENPPLPPERPADMPRDTTPYISSREEFDALAPGTIFIDGAGRRRRKKEPPIPTPPTRPADMPLQQPGLLERFRDAILPNGQPIELDNEIGVPPRAPEPSSAPSAPSAPPPFRPPAAGDTPLEIGSPTDARGPGYTGTPPRGMLRGIETWGAPLQRPDLSSAITPPPRPIMSATRGVTQGDDPRQGVFGDWGVLNPQERIEGQQQRIDDAAAAERQLRQRIEEFAPQQQRNVERLEQMRANPPGPGASLAERESYRRNLADMEEAVRAVVPDQERRQRAASQGVGAARAGEAPVTTQTRAAADALPRAASDIVTSVPALRARINRDILSVVPDWVRNSAVGRILEGEALLAEAAERVPQRAFPGDPSRQEETPVALASGAGSMVAFLAAGAINPALAGAAGATAQGRQQYDDAVKHGADMVTRYQAMIAGMGLGASEALPIMNFLDRLNEVSGGRAGRYVLNRLEAIGRGAAVGGAEEFLQELTQAVGSDAVARALYDPNRQVLSANSLQQAQVGGILGAVLGAAGGAGRRTPSNDRERAVRDLYDRARRESDELPADDVEPLTPESVPGGSATPPPPPPPPPAPEGTPAAPVPTPSGAPGTAPILPRPGATPPPPPPRSDSTDLPTPTLPDDIDEDRPAPAPAAEEPAPSIADFVRTPEDAAIVAILRADNMTDSEIAPMPRAEAALLAQVASEAGVRASRDDVEAVLEEVRELRAARDQRARTPEPARTQNPTAPEPNFEFPAASAQSGSLNTSENRPAPPVTPAAAPPANATVTPPPAAPNTPVAVPPANAAATPANAQILGIRNEDGVVQPGTTPVAPPVDRGEVLAGENAPIQSTLFRAGNAYEMNPQNGMDPSGFVNRDELRAVPPEVRDQVYAHGLNSEAGLVRLLENGVDPNREWFTGEIGVDNGYGVTAKPGNFMVLVNPETPRQIEGVLVGPKHAAAIPDLQRTFPNLRFIGPGQVGPGLESLVAARGSTNGGYRSPPAPLVQPVSTPVAGVAGGAPLSASPAARIDIPSFNLAQGFFAPPAAEAAPAARVAAENVLAEAGASERDVPDGTTERVAKAVEAGADPATALIEAAIDAAPPGPVADALKATKAKRTRDGNQRGKPAQNGQGNPEPDADGNRAAAVSAAAPAQSGARGVAGDRPQARAGDQRAQAAPDTQAERPAEVEDDGEQFSVATPPRGGGGRGRNAPPRRPSSRIGAAAGLRRNFERIKGRIFKTNRDLKLEMQSEVQALAREEGVDLTKEDDVTREYIAETALEDVREALKSNSNAIGWYSRTIRKAHAVLALTHPELATDSNARFAFDVVLAITSNGMKVDRNFVLADKAYREWKRTGRFPENIGEGNAAKAINNTMRLMNRMMDAWGVETTAKFLESDFTVSELDRVLSALGSKIAGENRDARVLGAMVFGPKIGNGFYANLRGIFSRLTIDRWNMRTWGRWIGRLVYVDEVNVRKTRRRVTDAVRALRADKEALRQVESALGGKLGSFGGVDALAAQIKKVSQNKALREQMSATAAGNELRKAGNRLHQYLDGQIEQPRDGNQRAYMRSVYDIVLARSKQFADMSMADLQALLWYPEKRLYEASKEKDDGSEGYEDDEAPDYANAAVALAKSNGVSEADIQRALDRAEQEEGNDAGRAQRDDGQSGRGQGPVDAQGRVGGFDGKERKRFLVREVISRAFRPGGAYSQTASGPYAGRARRDDDRLRVLGFAPTQAYTPAVKFKNAAAEIDSVAEKIYEMPAEAAEAFRAAITASKNSTPFGAAVHVYEAGEYADMRLFLNEAGDAGFALKGDDIVSVFSPGAGRANTMLQLAVQLGGRRLDAFDTVLPEIYSANGFKTVSRMPWNEEYKPTGWDKKVFAKFNNGEPDVVFMVYDPDSYDYATKQDGVRTTDYDEATRIQAEAVQATNQRMGDQFSLSDLGFYSAVERAIERAKITKGTAQQWMATLRNQPGVKAEELAWLQLEDFLGNRTGITQGELLNYVRENSLQIEEVRLGETGNPYYVEAKGASFFAVMKDGRPVDRAFYATRDTAQQAADALWRSKGGKRAVVRSTRHHNWVTHGDQNTYREFLLTLPPQRGRYGPNEQFTHSHWYGFSNVVAHVRFKVRTVGGKKVLELNEIQSDLHQRGRKQGYKLPDLAFDAEVSRLETEIAAKREAAARASYDATEARAASNQDFRNDALFLEAQRLRGIEHDLHREYVAARDRLMAMRRSREHGVPDAPFKATTDWTALVLKRMIRYAAEQGYDQIAWDIGQVHNDRYPGLEEHIDEIIYRPHLPDDPNGPGTLLFKRKGGSDMPIVAGYYDSIDGVDEYIGREPAERLKAAASQSNGDRTLPGLDLRVGGHKMQKFYDEMVVNVANKLGKKFGAQVQRFVKLPIGKQKSSRVYDVFVEGQLGDVFGTRQEAQEYAADFEDRSARRSRSNNADVEIVARDVPSLPYAVVVNGLTVQAFSAREDADLYVEDNFNGPSDVISVVYRGDSIDVHVMDITPEMRQSVLEEGFPLFRAQGEGIAADPSLVSEQTYTRVDEAALRVAGVPPNYVDTIDVAPNAQGRAAWGADDAAPLKAAGSYNRFKDAMTLARDIGANTRTAYHEAFHRLQAYFLRPRERDLLKQPQNVERLRALLRNDPDRRDQADSMSQSELEAEAFAIFSVAREQRRDIPGLHGAIRRAWEAMRIYIGQVASFVQGRGMTTTDSLFRDAFEGKVKERTPNARPAAPDNAVPDADQYALAPTDPRNPALSLAIAQAFRYPFKPGTWKERVKEAFIRTMQNRLIDVDRLAEQLGEKIGAPRDPISGRYILPEEIDPRLGFRLARGKTKDQLDKLKADEVEPILAAMAKHGITHEQLNQFLVAQHTAERRATLRSRYEPTAPEYARLNDPNDPFGTGMSENAAAAFLSSLTPDQRAKYEEVANKVYAMNRRTLARLYRAGNITQDTYTELTGRWKFYVPLNTLEADGEMTDGAGVGTGFDNRGKIVKTMFGRSTNDTDPLTYAVVAASTTIIKTEKIRASQRFSRFVQEYHKQFPDQTIFEVLKTPRREVWDPLTGTFKNSITKEELKAVTPMTKRMDKTTGMILNGVDMQAFQKDDVLAISYRGEFEYIRINHKGLAAGIKNLDGTELNTVMRWIQAYTQFMSRLATSLNPDFFLVNGARDALTGLANMGDLSIPNATAQFTKNYGAYYKDLIAAKGSLNAMRRSPGRMGKYLDEFTSFGAPTSWVDFQNPEQMQRSLEADLRALTQPHSPAVLAGKAAESVFKVFEIVNNNIETSTRLALYATLRDAGWSQERAALAAKELTVNFEEKGTASTVFGSLYMFFNAAVQGNVRLVRAIAKTKRGQMAVSTLFMMGAAEALLHALPGDEEEWRKYDQIADYTMERNLFIPIGGGDKIKIPMPYGFNVFSTMGREVMRGAINYGKGDKSLGDAIMTSVLRMTSAAMGSFNPLGGSFTVNDPRAWAAALVPTFAKPGIELGFNRNFTGAPIYPPSSTFDRRPDSQQSFRTTGDISKWIAESLNLITGGSSVRPGWIDITPGSIQHIIGTATGGAGRFWYNAVDAAWKIGTGNAQDINLRQAPILRQIAHRYDANSEARNEYFQLNERARALDGIITTARRQNQPNEARIARERDPIASQLLPHMQQAWRQMSRFNDMEKAIKGQANLSEAERRQRLRAIDIQRGQVYERVTVRARELERRQNRGSAEAPAHHRAPAR